MPPSPRPTRNSARTSRKRDDERDAERRSLQYFPVSNNVLVLSTCFINFEIWTPHPEKILVESEENTQSMGPCF